MPRPSDISLLTLSAAGRGTARVDIQGDDIVLGIGDGSESKRGSFTRAQAVTIADSIYDAAGEDEDKSNDS